MIIAKFKVLNMTGLLATLVAASPAGAWVHASGGGSSSSHWGGGGSYGSSSSYHSDGSGYGSASSTHTGEYGGTTTKTAAGGVTTNPNGTKSYAGGEQTTYTAPVPPMMEPRRRITRIPPAPATARTTDHHIRPTAPRQGPRPITVRTTELRRILPIIRRQRSPTMVRAATTAVVGLPRVLPLRVSQWV
jgi:hypothetical protein